MACKITLLDSDILSFDALRCVKYSKYSKRIVITDATVFHLYGNEIKHSFGNKIVIIPSGEEGKSLSVAEKCWKKLIDYECDRKSLLIAVGGGAVTDLAGFVAACYMRSIDHICIPTTLMGMVDASIGGKTGVNFCGTKNLVGAIHLPKHVGIHPFFLKSLPQREYISGIAEVIKYGIVRNELFFNYLEENIEKLVERVPEVIHHVLINSVKIKSEIVNMDQKDESIRSFLNFGHSFAHGLESATHYQSYLHGEAVSIGMCLAATLSHQMGKCDETVPKRIEKLCKKANLPVELSKVSANQLITYMLRDKKNEFGKFNLIVVKKIGKVVRVKDVDIILIKKTVSR